MNFPLMNYIKSISQRPILFIIGEHAHSRYFIEDIYEMDAELKKTYVIPNAGHGFSGSYAQDASGRMVKFISKNSI